MKILINSITNTEIAQAQEEDPKFQGTFTISGQQFIPGEWVHVPDNFGPLTDYPYIKEAGVVLAERTKQVLEENGLNSFAKGVQESYALYKDQPVDAARDELCAAVVKIAQVKAVEEIDGDK